MNAARLLTDELRAKLRANAENPGVDHVPVVKFFNPVGAGSWLATELSANDDLLFGIADLGVGCPEIGPFGLAELEAVALPFGLGIERDGAFSSEHPLSV